MAQQNKYRDIDKNVYDIISIEHLDGDDLSATLVRPNSIAPADLTFYVQSTTILKENVLYVYNFSFPYNITNSITAINSLLLDFLQVLPLD